MKRPLLQAALACWVALLVTSPASAEYESLGVTRASVEAMLKAEGLNPQPNTYPDFEGEKVTELNVLDPLISIQMYGPDAGLTAIEITIRPSADPNDAHWQSYVSLWVLNAVFPDWENREEWLVRTLRSLAQGGSAESMAFERDGRTVETAFNQQLFFLAVSGKEIEE